MRSLSQLTLLCTEQGKHPFACRQVSKSNTGHFGLKFHFLSQKSILLPNVFPWIFFTFSSSQHIGYAILVHIKSIMIEVSQMPKFSIMLRISISHVHIKFHITFSLGNCHNGYHFHSKVILIP